MTLLRPTWFCCRPTSGRCRACSSGRLRRYGDRRLISRGDGSWTLSRGARHCRRPSARACARQALPAGDRVAIICSNRLEMLEIVLGCGWIGAIAVPINTAAMGPQIAYYAGEQRRAAAGDRGAVRSSGSAHVDRTAWRRCDAIWVIGSRCAAESAAHADASRAAARRADRSRRPSTPATPLAILYTSGTTGPSKGVICPHAQYYWWGVNSADVLGVGAGDVLCTTLPLFHINALNTFAQALLDRRAHGRSSRAFRPPASGRR